MNWTPLQIEERGYSALELEDANEQADVLLDYFGAKSNRQGQARAGFGQRALKSGVAGMKSNLAYAGAIYEDFFGTEEAFQEQIAEAKTQEQYAQKLRDAAGVEDFKDLVKDGDAKDWAKYFLFLGAEITPHVAATIASSGVGGFIALGAKVGLKSFIKRKAKKLAKDRFVRNGALLGGFTHEYLQGLGETYGFTEDANISIAAAAPYAALNFFSTLAFGNAMLKEAAGTALEGQAKSYLKTVLKNFGKGAATEGITEELQTEVQLLAKEFADPSFNWASLDANMMRLESLVAGSVLGGTIRGGGSAISQPIGAGVNAFREGREKGAADFEKGRDAGAKDFEDGARQAEQDFLPETDLQIITQLDELEAGRGREAVQVTSGPLPELELQTRKMQQIALDNEQGVLIARQDQDIQELKAAFESGSRDVLGNGTINKPVEGTEVVRAVNADGARGADVVADSNTVENVTAAQAVKSDIGQTETVSAEQAVQERLMERDAAEQSQPAQPTPGTQAIQAKLAATDGAAPVTGTKEAVQERLAQLDAPAQIADQQAVADQQQNLAQPEDELAAAQIQERLREFDSVLQQESGDPVRVNDYPEDNAAKPKLNPTLRRFLGQLQLLEQNGIDLRNPEVLLPYLVSAREELLGRPLRPDESELLRQNISYTDVLNVLNNLGTEKSPVGTGIDFDALENMSTTDGPPTRTYGSNLSSLEGAAPYQTEESAQKAIETQLLPRRIKAEQAKAQRLLTESEIQNLRDNMSVVEVDGGDFFKGETGFRIEEITNSPVDVKYIEKAINVAKGASNYKKGKKLTHVTFVKRALAKIIEKPLSIEEIKKLVAKLPEDSLDLVFAVIDPNGEYLVLDLKTMATRGAEYLRSTAATPFNLTDAAYLENGLTQVLADLGDLGYNLVEPGTFGALELGIVPGKKFGKDGPTLGEGQPFAQNPISEEELSNRTLNKRTSEDPLYALSRNRETNRRVPLDPPDENEGVNLTPDSEAYKPAVAEDAENNSISIDNPKDQIVNDAATRDAARNDQSKFTNWARIPAKFATEHVKLLSGYEVPKLLMQVANTLAKALKFTNTRALILDSASLVAMLERNDVDPNTRKLLEAIVKEKPLGRSITDPSKDYGIVFVNTTRISEIFPIKDAAGKAIQGALGKRRAYLAFVLSHELGHTYFESTIRNLPKADKLALVALFNAHSTADFYRDKFKNEAVAINEWFADRVASLSMQIIGKRASSQLDGPDFFNQKVDAAFKPTGPLLDDSVQRDPESTYISVKNIAKEIAKKLRGIYDVWSENFAKREFEKGRMMPDPNFNAWLNSVINGKGALTQNNPSQNSVASKPVKAIQPLEKSVPKQNADPGRLDREIDESQQASQEIREAQEAQEAEKSSYFGISEPVEAREADERAAFEALLEQSNLEGPTISDFGEFQTFLDSYTIPRNRLQFEKLAKKLYEGGVGSFLGKIFFSAHEQLTVMGAAGRKIANALYKKSSTLGRDGFLQSSIFKFNQKAARIVGILPKDKEAAAQVLDAFGIWRENGADLNNIPLAIRPYRIKLTNFFNEISAEMAAVNPEFEMRENYFMHLYDPEKLNNPETQQKLVSLLVAREALSYEAAGQAVNKLRGMLLASSQHTDPVGVAAHSQEARVFNAVTYAELREAGVLYEPMTSLLKYTREMTRATEFHRMFGGSRLIRVKTKTGQTKLVNKYFPDKELRDLLTAVPIDQRAQAQHIIDGMLGRLGSKVNPTWSKAQSWLMALQFSTTLLFAQLASLPDIMMPALRSREMSGLAMNVEQIARMMNSQDRAEMIQFATDMGTVSQDMIHEAITAGFGSEWMDPGARKFTDAFFTYTGLEHWTRLTRIVATGMARDFLIKHAVDPNQRSERYLAELEIDAGIIQAWLDSGKDFNTPAGKEVQLAIMRFTDEAILRPNSAERPTYGSDPRFMLLFQLKGFYYSFGQKVVGGLYREMQSRRAAGESIPAAMTPMLIAGVALMPLAAIALGIREELKYEDGEEPTARMDSSDYLFELVSRSGFLGPLEIPKSMFDAADYGTPFWVAPAGPTAGTAYDLINSEGWDGLSRLIPVYNQLK